jgi:hypothetical protein
MKLWIADGVLTDYSDGIVVLFANSEKEAIEKFYETDDTAFYTLYSESTKCDCNADGNRSKHIMEYHKPTKLPDVFKLIKTTSAFVVWGGS